MSYITKDQLNLYLQKVSSQSTGPGAIGTARSRSTLTGPRPPTFGSRVAGRKIFQDGPPSGATPPTPPKPSMPATSTTPQLDSAVKNLSLSSLPSTPVNQQRPASPILESMGEAVQEVVMESMGSEDYEAAGAMYRQQHYGTFPGQQGYGPTGQLWHAQGYANQATPSQFYHNHHDNNQQQHPMHLSQEQYLQLQQQQYEQQQGYLRHQHSAHAAAHGYIPTQSPSAVHAQLQGPESTHLHHPKPTAPTVSKTITPRIVPVVDIPEYTIINPPKTEIDDEAEEDNNWAPEPPPRESAKKVTPRTSSPYRSSESSKTLGSSVPMAGSSQHVEASESRSPRSTSSSTLSSQAGTPNPGEATSPTMVALEEDRVPMPPPREFLRKGSTTTPPPPPSLPGVTNGVFKPSSPANGSRPTSSSSSSSSSSSPSRIAGIPAPGTVRANSAKFNSLISAGTTNSLSPKTLAPKGKNTGTSPTEATAIAVSNPWTSRKAIETLRKNSLSKECGAASRNSLEAHSDTAIWNSKPVPVPPELDVDKELPPIIAATPQSPAAASSIEMDQQIGAQYDESKCILTDEDRAISLSSIPMAPDTSMEVLVQEENTTTAGNPILPPSKPTRGSDAGSGSGHQTGFVCSSCDEPISGMMITAMGKRWHSDHFVCAVCNLNLEHVQFFQKDGLPYCHLDYHEKFSPKCGHCNTAIEDECLTALGKSWHPGHFFCRECGDPFEDDGYMVHDDQPYCEKDYLRLFAPKCTGCQDPIQGDFINALKGKWHRDCFGCTVCHIGFDSSSYYVENGKPYCQTHYKSGAKSLST
ncbi:hypothetical protein BGZ68_010778 [Mortierella alpina]|nr:hypothetical protein BGZ68_010778 [Mortierella alpina]